MIAIMFGAVLTDHQAALLTGRAYPDAEPRKARGRGVGYLVVVSADDLRANPGLDLDAHVMFDAPLKLATIQRLPEHTTAHAAWLKYAAWAKKQGAQLGPGTLMLVTVDV